MSMALYDRAPYERKSVTLTKRELENLYYLSSGYTYKEIANKLNIAPNTVEKYIDKIKHKTGLYCRSEIVGLFFANYAPNMHSMPPLSGKNILSRIIWEARVYGVANDA